PFPLFFKSKTYKSMQIQTFCNRHVLPISRKAHENRFVTRTRVFMRVTFMLLTAFCMQSSAVAGPQIKIEVPAIDQELIETRGRVVDEAGEPVSGATVKVKGRNIGTSTDANGDFFLSGLDENAVLEISGVNIQTFEIKLAGR